MSESNQPPAEVHQSCTILGLQVEGLSPERIISAWKNKLLATTTANSNDEYIVSLNVAKNVLLNWLGGSEAAGVCSDR